MSEGTVPDVAAQERADLLRERLKERIYASLTLLAVLVGLAQSGHPSHVGAAVSVTVTALGLWLATLVADLQAHPVAHGRFPRLPEIRHTLFTSSPLLTSAIGPLLLTGLSALGVMKLTTALWISVGSEVAALAAWGFTGGRRVGAGLLGSLISAALNAVIGVGVVSVKLLAGH
ncbi:hypothetical protein [Streptomyces longispororuber]|uniref:hypothetical protein n=1 Tax=Streptomyces longispororuber TaxID=68230 RepID=UPI00210CD86B|nr:hypothetical protein [Streptomyces longispororuber]MCQ4212614.1 hypothetical protein [Streptomyces longispororuber]